MAYRLETTAGICQVNCRSQWKKKIYSVGQNNRGTQTRESREGQRREVQREREETPKPVDPADANLAHRFPVRPRLRSLQNLSASRDHLVPFNFSAFLSAFFFCRPSPFACLEGSRYGLVRFTVKDAARELRSGSRRVATFHHVTRLRRLRRLLSYSPFGSPEEARQSGGSVRNRVRWRFYQPPQFYPPVCSSQWGT